MKRIVLLILVVLPILTGCYDMKEVSDELYAIIMAVDKTNEGIKISVAVPEYASKEEYQTSVYSVTAQDMTEAVRALNFMKSRKISLLHLKAVIFSEELAKYGLFEHASVLQRHMETTTAMGVVISKCKAEELLSYMCDNTSGDISSETELLLLSDRYNQAYPTILFEEFFNNMTSLYKSPCALYADAGEEFMVGIATFENDVMTGFLDKKSSGFCMLALGENDSMLMDFDVDGEKVWVNLMCKDRKIKVKNSIMLSLSLEGKMEYTPHMSHLIDEIERQIKDGVVKSIRRAAALNCDILGAKGISAKNSIFINDWEQKKIDYENVIVDLKLELLQNVNG